MGVIASQKLPRDGGESIDFATRHQDVSQGPLGKHPPQGLFRVAQEPNWNRKPEPSEPFP